MNKWFSDHLNTVIAFTISILTLFSGLLGWHMGNISEDASEAYALAQRAELNAQKVISTNTMNAYENHRAFLEYKNYFDQYKLVSSQLDQAQKADSIDQVLVTELTGQRDELQLLYLASLKLFPNRFINRDGTYDLQGQIGQMIASDKRKFDMNPDPHMKEGRQYETQARNMQIALIILAVSLFCFAIVSTVQNLKQPLMLIMIALGYITAIAGMTMGILYWN